MRAPAFAVATAAIAVVPAVVVATALSAAPDQTAWQAACSDWSTTRFVLTATCRDDGGSEHTSSVNLLACGEPPAIVVVDGRLTCALPTAEPVAGTWADRCVGGHIVDDAGGSRLVAFCAADDGDYLMPESLRLADCAEPASVVLADGALACAPASHVTDSDGDIGRSTDATAERPP